MKNKESKDSLEQQSRKSSIWIVIAGVLIIILVLALIDIWNIGSMQSVVVVISSVAAAVVTYLLLQGQKYDEYRQREANEKRRKEERDWQEARSKTDMDWKDQRRKEEQQWEDERRRAEREWQEARSKEEAKRTENTQIYSNKIAAFSAFNEAVWKENMDTRDDDRETVINIRKELFSRVILYLSSSEIEQITNAISGENKQFPYVLSSIVNILNQNAENTLAGKDNVEEKNEENNVAYRKGCQSLWDKFNEWLDDIAPTPSQTGVSQETGNAEKKQIKSGIQPWHFCQWSGKQLESLRNGVMELSLVEYGESWRTEMVKLVKKGDLIFLFQGSKRYAGAFEAKGWRVFEYDSDRYVREITSSGIEKVVVLGEKVPIEDVAESLKKYDIYESFRNPDSTFCANVVVDTISFPGAGVPNPNTTYRKTISRYYPGYAVNLLNEFLNADPANKEKIDQFFE